MSIIYGVVKEGHSPCTKSDKSISFVTLTGATALTDKEGVNQELTTQYHSPAERPNQAK